jgi:hypothetical protein
MTPPQCGLLGNDALLLPLSAAFAGQVWPLDAALLPPDPRTNRGMGAYPYIRPPSLLVPLATPAPHSLPHLLCVSGHSLRPPNHRMCL